MTDNNAMRQSEYRFPVRYAETDAMGVVHHASYLVYFEAGRSHLMRKLGCEYAVLEAQGFQLPVTEVNLRYVNSLRYGQDVRLIITIAENRSRQMLFSYEVYADDSQECLVTGFTRHVWTNKAGKVIRSPLQWADLLT